VIDGRSLHGVPLESLNDPNVDVITTHHYPFGDDHDFSQEIRAAHAVTQGKKPYLVGEFGFVETPHIAAAIQTVIDDGISGALLWSLRMHRREGGFYWHMEVGTGRNIYKAFHWPGFDSGERYDEQQVVALVREKAHEIRRLVPPPLPVPASPRLLDIQRVSAVSWQGSAGAESYEVWRAEEPGGPWRRIAESVSDAEVQYRPLYNDTSAEPGNSYYYRVVARNGSGSSASSNVVGPVAVDCRTLVDECADLATLHERAGHVSLATENARTVQEDCHRFALRPGARITYRVDGPISKWRVYAFTRNGEALVDASVSADGKEYRPLVVRQKAFPSSQSVYGYLTPVLLEGELGESEAGLLRIALKGAANIDQLKDASDVSALPPIEISRVEIEYDRISPASK
jgi:hypothetical protein